MIRIPRAKYVDFVVNGVEDQGNDKLGADVQYYWEEMSTKEHKARVMSGW